MPYFSIASAYVIRGKRAGAPAARFAPERADQPFGERDDVSGGDERRLDVDLRELGLAVLAQVFVAEAARDLEVAVEARPP